RNRGVRHAECGRSEFHALRYQSATSPFFKSLRNEFIDVEVFAAKCHVEIRFLQGARVRGDVRDMHVSTPALTAGHAADLGQSHASDHLITHPSSHCVSSAPVAPV